MLKLSFGIESCRPDPVALAPQLLFGLRVTANVPVHAALLRCQARIRPSARRYSAAEQAELLEIFGTPERWGDTLRDMLWTQVSVSTPGFYDSTLTEIAVPCSHDFDLATTKLFEALEGGDLPLALLFSGTVFYEGAGAAVQVAQVPWDHEAHYALPLAVWQRLMARHYADHVWVRVPRATLDGLRRHQRDAGLATVGEAVDDLLAAHLGCAGTTRRGAAMNRPLLDKIVAAVLYEGYILYPYRPSVKNRQRWTFGGLYPEAYCQAQKGADASFCQAEVLVEGDADTVLEVGVRFLHLTNRTVGALNAPVADWPGEAAAPTFRIVDSLDVGGTTLQPWQEAEEREIHVGRVTLADLMHGAQRRPFTVAGRRWLEPVHDAGGEVCAVLARAQQPLDGVVSVRAREVDGGLFRVSVRVENQTPFDGVAADRDAALLRSLVSTHVLLGVEHGAFVSLLDPPDEWRDAAAECRNVGVWPVLVGDDGDRDTMLASPIILYDYPQIAPESPGDLFDGTEIDEILTLRILTLTDEEKRQAAGVDDKARALLARTEALAREQLLGLHGTVRGLRAVSEERP